MDFPKKQAQRLMPLYLLEYSEKLFTNHPNPEDPWGGGSDYTAGQGITITNDVISVDDTIAKKSEIPTNYVTLDTEQTITMPKRMISRLSIGDPTGDEIFIDGTYGRGQLINMYNAELGSAFCMMIDDGTIQGNTGAYFTYEDDKGLREYRLPHQDREGLTTCTLATNLDIPSLDGYATQTWVQEQGYLPSDSLRDVYKAEAEISSGQYKVFPHYSGIEYSKEFEDRRLAIKLEDIDNANRPTITIWDHERTYIDPGHIHTVSSDQQTHTEMDIDSFKVSTDGGMNYTTFRQGGFDYNDIRFNLNSNKTRLENYTIATLDDISGLEATVINHTTQINSINSNITDLQTLTSTHTAQISGINSSITSLESLVNTNTSNISTIQNNLSTISSNITTLEELTSTHTSQISALQTSVSNCVTLSQLSTTLSDYALKSEVPSYSLSTTSTPVLSSATLSQSYETLTFTYEDNTTASFNFLTTGTTLSTSTINVLNSTTLS